MGGSIAVTVREESGKEHRMCRWTNVLPAFVNNIRLINKDPEHLQKYLKTWYEMKEDYERHKEKGNFEQNMTPVYAPYPFLAPNEYGLVVIDMQKNHILSYQDYASLGSIDSVAVAGEMNYFYHPELRTILMGGRNDPGRFGKKAFYVQDNCTSAVSFRELLEKGRVTEARDYRNEKTISLDGKSLDDVVRIIEDDHKGDLYFPIDMSPLQIINYRKHDFEEAEKIKDKILELGFKLTIEENKLWDDWINR